jgi:hypothetical protein
MDDDDDETIGYWKTNLLELQEKAPKPKMVANECEIPGKPNFYGPEFHGFIERKDAEKVRIFYGTYLQALDENYFIIKFFPYCDLR